MRSTVYAVCARTGARGGSCVDVRQLHLALLLDLIELCQPPSGLCQIVEGTHVVDILAMLEVVKSCTALLKVLFEALLMLSL